MGLKVIPDIYLPFTSIDIWFRTDFCLVHSKYKPDIDTRMVWKFYKSTQYQYLPGMD